MKREIAELLGRLGLAKPAKTVAIFLGLHETKEHGHEFMVREITLRAEAGENLSGKLLIEIGTTREDLPGLGSTEILAKLCRFHGMRMITVDMDEENTLRARDKMVNFSDTFSAICSRGEDFLANFTETIDFIYLDAFDFEHPNHSDKRKRKYQKILGTSINNAACQKMHFDCAVEIVRLSNSGTVIVFDDVWLEKGTWKGKGETAIPYLTDNGFIVRGAGKNASTLSTGK